MNDKFEFRYFNACIFQYYFIGWALQLISNYISSHPNTLNSGLPYDELTLIKKITNHLSVTKTPNDVIQFKSYMQQLLSCVSLILLRIISLQQKIQFFYFKYFDFQTNIHSRTSILTFLLCMAENGKNMNTSDTFTTSIVHDMKFKVNSNYSTQNLQNKDY